MSGPPPWTTTGFRPTYLSRTTSRANSSRRAGSSMAAPPYLITTVWPWNSRMYGSASRRVAMSRKGVTPCLRPVGALDNGAWASGQSKWSCHVLRVDRYVLVAEVAEEDLGLEAVAG